MARLEILDAGSWAGFVSAPAAVLMLGKSDCAACADWSAELERLPGADPRWGHVRFGKILLDQRGLLEFKRAHPWIAGIEQLPHNVLFRAGERVAEFAGGGTQRLVARLERVFGAPGEASP